MGEQPTLYHFTCDHGREGLGERGVLQPWSHGVVWLTDLDMPMREPLGLTSYILRCDRTAHRYRVTDTGTCVPWAHYDRRDRSIEIEGTRPMHWWVSAEPVPVVYAPMRIDDLLTGEQRTLLHDDLAKIAATRTRGEAEAGGLMLP